MKISTSTFLHNLSDLTGPLGPAWIDSKGIADTPLAPGLLKFISIARAMSNVDGYGTIYAVSLSDVAVTTGPWHYDLGEYNESGAERFVGTWATDDYPLSNVFCVKGNWIQPPNNRVVMFNEGTDLHRREAVPARPGHSGVFISMALYADDEPANLDCPRLQPLRTRGHYAELAKTHNPVTRKSY